MAKIMIALFLIGAAGFVAAMAFALVVAVMRWLALVVLPALMAGIAAFVLTMAITDLASADGDPASHALAAVGSALVAFLTVLVRLSATKPARSIPAFAAQTAEKSPQEPAGYEDVGDAWERALRLAPSRREDLEAAREDCSLLLHEHRRAAGIADPELLETEILLRRYLPSLVSGTEDRLRTTRRKDRAPIREELTGFLAAFGRRSREVLDRLGKSAAERDVVLRNHLTNRLIRGPEELGGT
ncbi:hypothetical protein B2G71_23090 [Novosphingobium sp. PC22D]|uniref:hypothetical protein n=1 Tax=Novosphingobium sp. PC22D TaxID=1962403 RepID=UPI000BF1DB20|nr:hypothetical protein [Novosphingobium sp. PC22D]PEQ10302.1 hypothetical protein B2G71_23090 [Novosphingobium sp. PC22D]